jgi:hypothetical protein
MRESRAGDADGRAPHRRLSAHHQRRSKRRFQTSSCSSRRTSPRTSRALHTSPTAECSPK